MLAIQVLFYCWEMSKVKCRNESFTLKRRSSYKQNLELLVFYFKNKFFFIKKKFGGLLLLQDFYESIRILQLVWFELKWVQNLNNFTEYKQPSLFFSRSFPAFPRTAHHDTLWRSGLFSHSSNTLERATHQHSSSSPSLDTF